MQANFGICSKKGIQTRVPSQKNFITIYAQFRCIILHIPITPQITETFRNTGEGSISPDFAFHEPILQ